MIQRLIAIFIISLKSAQARSRLLCLAHGWSGTGLRRPFRTTWWRLFSIGKVPRIILNGVCFTEQSEDVLKEYILNRCRQLSLLTSDSFIFPCLLGAYELVIQQILVKSACIIVCLIWTFGKTQSAHSTGKRRSLDKVNLVRRMKLERLNPDLPES